MEALIKLAGQLMPVSILLLIVVALYLAYLFKAASTEFIEIAKQQSNFLKDRIDVIDKSTGVFTRTISQQEKEIEDLKKRLGDLTAHIESTIKTESRLSVDELSSFSKSLADLSQLQEVTLNLIKEKKDEPTLKEARRFRHDIENTLKTEVSRLMESRGVSSFLFRVIDAEGSQKVVDILSEQGLNASIYESELFQNERLTHDNHQAIWVGINVPASLVTSAIRKARVIWPHLKYIELSTHPRRDPPYYVHNEVFLGGATQTAHEDKLDPWTEEDFAQLEDDLDQDALHRLIKEKR